MAVGNGTGWAGSASYLPWPVGGVRGEEGPYLGERLLDSGCYGSPQRGTLWLSCPGALGGGSSVPPLGGRPRAEQELGQEN